MAVPFDVRVTGWEISDPDYVVTVWTEHCEGAWASATSRLSAVDVHDALRQAEQLADGERHVLHVLVPHDGDVGMIRLVGDDPTAAAETIRPPFS